MDEDKGRDLLLLNEGPPQSFLDSKLALRRELIALPFEEKIRRVVEMQKMQKTLRAENKREIFVWNI